MASKLYLLKKTNYENLENYFRLNICFYLHKKTTSLKLCSGCMLIS